MNREVIRKYKKEFDHWLNGGSIFASSITNEGLAEDTWYPTDNPYWLNNCCYIINDEYVEFRKAIAEGKTVQRSYTNTANWVGWVDSNATDMLNHLPTQLRVKPNKPVFKIGDYINLPTGEPAKIVHLYDDEVRVGVYYKHFVHDTKKITDCVHWKPKKDEWCIFYDKDTEYYLISQFKGMEYFNKTLGEFYKSSTGVSYKNCIPYFGELP